MSVDIFHMTNDFLRGQGGLIALVGPASRVKIVEACDFGSDYEHVAAFDVDDLAEAVRASVTPFRQRHWSLSKGRILRSTRAGDVLVKDGRAFIYGHGEFTPIRVALGALT